MYGRKYKRKEKNAHNPIDFIYSKESKNVSFCRKVFCQTFFQKSLQEFEDSVLKVFYLLKEGIFLQIMLGDLILRTTEKPDFVQHGGGQMLAVNTFPGGNVSIQNFGPTYREISWEGWFEGTDAMDRMYKIGNMRQKGNPVIFRTETYSQLVVIKNFEPDHRTNFYIPFSITLERVVQITKQTPKEAVDKTAEEIKQQEDQKEKSIR